MSVVMMFGQPISSPRYTEPVTPATGPESSVSSGDSMRLRRPRSSRRRTA